MWKRLCFCGFREDLDPFLPQLVRDAKIGKESWPGCCPPRLPRQRPRVWWVVLDPAKSEELRCRRETLREHFTFPDAKQPAPKGTPFTNFLRFRGNSRQPGDGSFRMSNASVAPGPYQRQQPKLQQPPSPLLPPPRANTAPYTQKGTPSAVHTQPEEASTHKSPPTTSINTESGSVSAAPTAPSRPRTTDSKSETARLLSRSHSPASSGLLLLPPPSNAPHASLQDSQPQPPPMGHPTPVQSDTVAPPGQTSGSSSGPVSLNSSGTSSPSTPPPPAGYEKLPSEAAVRQAPALSPAAVTPAEHTTTTESRERARAGFHAAGVAASGSSRASLLGGQAGGGSAVVRGGL
ncbi:MAG: hypothetical protein WDW36_008035 [Sanguina aurantia]